MIVANGPYAIRAVAPAAGAADQPPELGVHGYDPSAMKSMRALFIAVGPDIRAGSTLEPFENVNVYPLVAEFWACRLPRSMAPSMSCQTSSRILPLRMHPS